jgi:uncharacterized protein (DUF362 family)
MSKHSTEFQAFDDAMMAILRADPKAVKQQMEEEKRTNAERRKAKKDPFASGRVSSRRD